MKVLEDAFNWPFSVNSNSRRFVASCSDSTVRGVRMVDPRRCSVARAVIMEHYRILVSPASCPGRATAAVGTGVSCGVITLTLLAAFL